MRTKKYYKLQKKNIYSGSGRIRTYCVSYVRVLQTRAHPPSEQHSLFYGKRSKLSLHFTCFVILEKLRSAVFSPLKTISFMSNVTSHFTAFIIVSSVIY